MFKLLMCYALIINRTEQLDKFKILSDMSILEILIFELIKINIEFYIVANKNFENDIYSTLNKHNYLINTNVHLILLESELDNYFITFILANLITDEIKLIPLDDFTFDNCKYHMITNNIKIKKKIIWNHPVYIINSSKFKCKFILNKKYNRCPIEFFIDHKKTEFKFFFNKVHRWCPEIVPTIDTINKIKEFDYYKLSLYKFK